MATVLATIVGDISDAVDHDFANAYVAMRYNKNSVRDPDNNKLRILDQPWSPVAADGTYSFTDVVGHIDELLDGSLQFYIDFRVVIIDRRDGPLIVAYGPYDASMLDGDADNEFTDLVEVEPVDPTDAPEVDEDVLAEAEDYIDGAIADHEAAVDPHPQYTQLVDASGITTGGRLIVVGPGGEFPPVEPGSVLIYGGS